MSTSASSSRVVKSLLLGAGAVMTIAGCSNDHPNDGTGDIGVEVEMHPPLLVVANADNYPNHTIQCPIPGVAIISETHGTGYNGNTTILTQPESTVRELCARVQMTLDAHPRAEGQNVTVVEALEGCSPVTTSETSATPSIADSFGC